MNQYVILSTIGEGAYGVVLKAKRRDNGEVVAIKKFKETDDDDLIKKTIVRQIKVLRSVRHKNIVALQQAFKKNGLVHLVFEYVDNNLLQVLEQQPGGLPIKTVAKMIYQLLEGLDYMHSLNWIHRDIKPENLLISAEGVLKICDMGFTKIIDNQMTDYVATRWYRPPELLLGANYGTAIDVWAVGCILAELTDTQPLFPGSDEIDQLTLTLSGLGPLPDYLNALTTKNPIFQNIFFPIRATKKHFLNKYSHKLGEKGVSLLKAMLELDPLKRITAKQALKHEFFDIIQPHKNRWQKTSGYWRGGTMGPADNLTDRVLHELTDIGSNLARSSNKQNCVTRKGFVKKFPMFSTPKKELNSEQSSLCVMETCSNRIYKKVNVQKSKLLMSLKDGQRREKFGLTVSHKFKTEFRVTHKSRQKSFRFANI